MEKRLVLAIGLSVLVLVAWNYIFPPPERPLPAQPTEMTDPAALDDSRRSPAKSSDDRLSEIETPAGDEIVPEEGPAGEPVRADREEEFTVETDLFEVVFTNRGARSTRWSLLDYRTGDGEPLELWPPFQEGDAYPLAIVMDSPTLTEQFNDALFRTERISVPAADGKQSGERIVFTWSDGNGTEARKTFTFRNGDPLVDIDVEVVDRGRLEPARLTLGPGIAAQEHRAGQSNYYYSSQVVWNRAGEVTRIKPRKLKPQGDQGGRFLWVGLEDQFFTALILPGDAPGRMTWTQIEQTPVPDVATDDEPEPTEVPIVAVAVGEGAQLYVGPKKYKMLKPLGHELEKSVWFSTYTWLGAIVKYIYLGLLWLHDNVTGNYGLAIILATAFLRLALFPVNQYSMVNMKKSQLQMQRLQPKIKGIKAKYKKAKDAESRGRMNQDMMDLYKREGVNPMGGVTGCLPMFAQFPILIGFYNMLTVAVELRGAPFYFWIQDLSVKDPYYVTPLLMGATMFLQQRLSMSRVTDPQQMQQQRIMMFMPFMFTFICLQMPSGLVLYWFVNNVLGIGQQWLVNKHTSKLELEPTKKPKLDAGKGGKKPRGKRQGA